MPDDDGAEVATVDRADLVVKGRRGPEALEKFLELEVVIRATASSQPAVEERSEHRRLRMLIVACARVQSMLRHRAGLPVSAFRKVQK
jgi:hypothetical protein